MNWKRATKALLAATFATWLTSGVTAHEPAPDGCLAHSRDVVHEVAVMRSPAISLLDRGTVVRSADHFGPGCDVLRKIVEFDLSAGRTLTLQLSGQDDAIIGLAITASPPAPKQERS